MAHAIIPCELNDPDFSWLLNSFLEQHPNSITIEVGSLPVVLLENEAPSYDDVTKNDAKTQDTNKNDFFNIDEELAKILKNS